MSALRLDRLATTCFCHPLVRLLPFRSERRVPILMYHAVQNQLSGMSPYFETSVSSGVFRSHMKMLHDEGYQVTSLEKSLEMLANGVTQKCAVVTFDDGYRNFYDDALPVLSDFGFTATVYLATAFTQDGHARFNGMECLTWVQIRELYALGIHFGSHTVNHPRLKDLPVEQVEQEIADSKKAIEDELGAPVRSFSYPYAFPEAYGEFKKRLRKILQKNGYENGVTTIIGTANAHSDRYFLPRLPANNWDDVRFFQAKLEGAYDWLHGAQYLSKVLGRFAPLVRLSRD